jgi:hypothetical protein
MFHLLLVLWPQWMQTLELAEINRLHEGQSIDPGRCCSTMAFLVSRFLVLGRTRSTLTTTTKRTGGGQYFAVLKCPAQFNADQANAIK